MPTQFTYVLKQFLVLVVLTSAFLGGPVHEGVTQSPDEDERPNVLFIFTDDQGWGDVGAYGAEELKTPQMDQMIENGMRFDRFYANSPVCSPTRAAVLSGRYPDLVGVPGVIRTNKDNSWGYLNPDAKLIAEPLNEAGYHTSVIGKWHLGLSAPNRPNDHGFDYFHGFLGDMMDDYWTHMRQGHNYMRRNTTKIDPDGHATDLFSEWAAEYIRNQSGNDRPWFLYLSYNAPHYPVQPPKKWVKRVKQREGDIHPKRAKLVAFIEHLDHGIGQVLDALKNSGQTEETLIIFTSDNGGHKGSHARVGPHRGYKQDMYEGGLAVPMCAVWPGHIEPGSRSDLVTTTMDLYPTILDAAGANIPANRDGVSLLPTLLGQPQSLDRYLIFLRRVGAGDRVYYAVRRGKWKLVQNRPSKQLKLYNLEQDPKEQNDVSDQRSSVFQDLKNALQQHVQRAERVPWQPPESRDE